MCFFSDSLFSRKLCLSKAIKDFWGLDGSEVVSDVPGARVRILAQRYDHQEPIFVFSDEEIAVLEAILGRVRVKESNYYILILLLGRAIRRR